MEYSITLRSSTINILNKIVQGIVCSSLSPVDFCLGFFDAGGWGYLPPPGFFPEGVYPPCHEGGRWGVPLPRIYAGIPAARHFYGTGFHMINRQGAGIYFAGTPSHGSRGGRGTSPPPGFFRRGGDPLPWSGRVEGTPLTEGSGFGRVTA